MNTVLNLRCVGANSRMLRCYIFFLLFLASQDALEVMVRWLDWKLWWVRYQPNITKKQWSDQSEQGQIYRRALPPMAVMLLRCNRIPVEEFAGWSMVSSRQFARKSCELKLLLHLPLGNLKLPFLQWQLKVVHSQSYLVRPPICDHNFAPCVCDMEGSSFWVRSGW